MQLTIPFSRGYIAYIEQIFMNHCIIKSFNHIICSIRIRDSEQIYSVKADTPDIPTTYKKGSMYRLAS